MLRWLSPRPRGISRTERRKRRFTPDTRAVLATALLSLLEAALEQGFRRDDVMSELDCRGEALKPTSRISWRDLTRAIDNLERAGMTADGFERAGAHVAAVPHFGVQAFAEFFLRPEHILLVGLKWIGPAIFPVLESRVDRAGRSLRLELTVPADFPGSVNYFHICRGAIGAVPVAVGQPKAAISATITSHHAVFDVECAPMLPGSWRFGRVVRALSSAPRVVEAFSRQDAAIRRAFELSAESQQQFRRILGALPDAVVVIRGDRVAYANPMLARLLGYERTSDLFGRSWADLFGNEIPRIEGGELRLVRGDGRPAWLELSPRQAIDYEGLPAELVVARDVTDRHEFYEKLALTDRVTSLGTLAAGLAHEINNPLALVISNLELARQSSSNDPLLVAATEGAERVRDIVRDLRVFSKPEAEERTPVDLEEVITSTVALARGRSRTRARIEVEARPTPLVMCNRGRLGQVVLNMILNALDAMPEGRDIDENRIVIRTDRCELGAAVEVTDNGVGIAPDTQKRMFEPFFTTRTGGSGLGLAVVHDIVTSIGGRIDVATAPDRGSTFRVELPRAESIRSPTRVDVAEARTSARILVADDEAPLLRVLEQALLAAGHQVDCVSSGTAALQALMAGGSYDVILCDLMMPDRSGAELYYDLAKQRADLARRIVFMTGGTYRPEARDFLATVENRCLEKPFGLAELGRVVSEVLTELGPDEVADEHCRPHTRKDCEAGT